MKELEKYLKEDIKMQADKQQQKETRVDFIGKIKPKNGQFVFEIDSVTEEVRRPKYKNSTVDYAKAVKGDFSGCNDLLIVEGCIYIPAINKANALRKYQQDPRQATYYSKKALMSLSDITF